MSCIVGTGTTFVLSAGNVGRVVSIGNFDESIDRISDDDLATVGYAKYCAGTKIDHSELEINVVFDPEKPTAIGTTLTGTITFAPGGQTLAGTGFLTARSFGGAANNERVEGTFTWSFDGDGTPPLYAP